MVKVLNTVETAPSEVPVLRVSTKYMEDPQMVVPVSGGTDVHAYINPDKNLDVYSVGTNDKVFRLRPNNDLYGPYEVEDLGIQARQLSLYAASDDHPGNPNILGLNQNGKVTRATYSNELGAYSQNEFQPSDATAQVEELLTLKSATGNIYANVILAGGKLANSYFTPGADKWESSDWVTVKDTDGGDMVVKSITMLRNSEVQSGLFAIGSNDRVWFSEDNFFFSKMRDLGYLNVSHISAIKDEDDLINIFAVKKEDGTLWLKQQKKHSSDHKIDFDDWVELPRFEGTPGLERIFAAKRFDNLLEVFGIGTDGRLYHIQQQLDGEGRHAKVVWDHLFQLGNEIGNSVFNVARDGNGYTSVYSVTHDDRLLRFWESPETSQWFSQEIQMEEPSQKNVVSVPTHSLEVTVLDASGAPMGDVDVSISTSFLSNLRINGMSYQTSAVDAIALKTDPNGRLVILQRANSLAAATVYITTPFVQDGQPIQVEPNAQLQDKIKGLTADDIMNAKDANGNYLLKDEYRTEGHAESIARISQQSMELGKGQQEAAPIMYLTASKYRRGWDPRVNFAAVNDQSWEIDFESGFPTYKDLSQEEVSEWKSNALLTMNADGIGDFLKSAWGKFWNGIKQGAEWLFNGLKKIIVEKIINPISGLVEKIKVFFHMVIDGITRVFETLLEFVQQAFDFIEGVWNWVKVKLKELYEWLAFFFNWGDIKRTAQAVEHSVNTTLDFTVLVVQHYRSIVENGFEEFKEKIDKGVDDFLDQLNGQPNIGNYGTDHTNKDQNKNQSSDHNPLLNAFSNNGGDGAISAATTASTNALQENVMASMEEVFDKIKDYADNFQFGDAKEAFDEAVDYFTQIGDNPSDALKLLISGTIKVAEALALVAIDIAEGIVLSLFDAIVEIIESLKESLNETWEIPVVSQIYKFITGDELGFKPLVLLSYVVAIPGTLMYKLITKEAPFPDGASVDKFKSQFTLDWLLKRSGIGAQRIAVRLDMSEEDRLKMKTIFLSINCANTFIRMILDGITAFTIAKGGSDEGGNGSSPSRGQKASKFLTDNGRKFALTAIVCRYISGILTMPWVLTKDAAGPTCEAGKIGFGVTNWICQMVFGPTRGLVCWFVGYKLKKNKYLPYVAEISLSVWGAAHIIMASVHFAKSASKGETSSKVTFARSMSLMIPAQILRFGDLPGLNKGAKFIPLIILEVCIGVGYLTSFGCNIAEAIAASKEQPGECNGFYVI